MSNKIINSWDWDVRVRDRNLKKGLLTDKDMEKQQAGLVDTNDQSEPVSLPQPALGGRE